MSTRAEDLYKSLKSPSAVKELIGQPEDSYFDCKEWPSNEGDAEKMVAKAACGFTNVEGGVLIIGMKAESKPKDEPDVVSGEAPVANTSFVRSRVLDLIGKFVHPGIVGLDAKEIAYPKGAKSGFVIILVPASEGPPRWFTKDKKFYQRIGSSTLTMEHSQIGDMFGNRPHPRLELSLEKERIGLSGGIGNPQRIFRLGLTNVGLGLAKFPSIRFKSNCGLWPERLGLDGMGTSGLPRRASGKEWVIFRGGIDDVVYPDETLAITFLCQVGENLGKDSPRPIPGGGWHTGTNQSRWRFKPITFSCEISCEGIQSITTERSFEEEDHFAPGPRS